MNSLKVSAFALAGVMVLTGLSACSRSGVHTGAENRTQPSTQTFGKSYVKELPETQVKKKEAELTTPSSTAKGPAVGGYETATTTTEKTKKVTHVNQPVKKTTYTTKSAPSTAHNTAKP